MPETIGIAELAGEFGITTRTIRFYEDKGLLTPARQGQRRVYSHRDRVRLKLIMRGKRLGFSLDEIAEMLGLYDQGSGEETQLRLFLDKIQERREQLLRQRRDIESILSELDGFEQRTRDLLSKQA
ncbi:MAG: MerR family transcriptional regulator [Magnetovibrionaceae bacterium]